MLKKQSQFLQTKLFPRIRTLKNKTNFLASLKSGNNFLYPHYCRSQSRPKVIVLSKYPIEKYQLLTIQSKKNININYHFLSDIY